MPRASGFDQWIINRTGLGTSGGKGAGPSQKITAGGGTVYSKAGNAAVGLVGSGADVDQAAETGAGVAGLVGSGARAVVHVKSGAGILASVGSGARQRLLARAGLGSAGGVGAGTSASELGETGRGVAGTTAAGQSAKTIGGIVKSGAGVAGTTARAARAVVYGRPTGHGTVGLVAAGSRLRVITRSGHAILEGTGTGLRQIEHTRAGHGVVGIEAFGDTRARFPANPPGGITKAQLGRLIATAHGTIAQSREGIVDREPQPDGGWIETPRQGVFG